MSGKVGDVAAVAGDQIVHRHDSVTFVQEAVCKVRAKKARAASDKYAQG
jgi:hypothetical protein